MLKTKNFKLILLLLCLLILSGCRGWFTEKAPIHPNPNLDWQPKYKAQKYIGQIPKHTKKYQINKSTKSGKVNGEYIKTIPIPVTKYVINEGEKNYGIYCSTCHTKTGNGTKSLISKRGWIASNLLEDVTYNKTDGELYHIVSYGIRSMPGYYKKLSIEERWSIVAYLRVLQQINRATINDLTKEEKKLIR